MSELRELLYCSVLSGDQPIQIVGRIITEARARNEADGITGLLVFDGARFCQHLEGPAEGIRALTDRLRADPRHTGMTVCFEGRLAARRYPRFDLGLAEVENGEELAELETLDGAAALARFLALRPRFDIAG